MTRSSLRVGLVATGTANTASVGAAFARLGVDLLPVEGPGLLVDLDALVLPGVGALGAAMEALHARELVEPLGRWVEAGRPVLGICLGLQLLCEGSEESPEVAGLGVIGGVCERFADDVRRPHMGWNPVRPPSPASLVPEGEAYFAHSYRLRDAPGFAVTWCEHGAPFVAAVERGGLLGCQFHPELSGSWGSRLLERWLERAAAVVDPRTQVPPPAAAAPRSEVRS